jgi:hypothetical protein
MSKREETLLRGERDLGDVTIQLPRDIAVLCCGGLRIEAQRYKNAGNEVMERAYTTLAEALYEATQKRGSG